MKIGVFDSGLGGLIIMKAVKKALPEYDYVYLGDTKRVPYGNRSEEAVFEFTKQGVDYLFNKENCAIVIIACNTASARALRKIQQEYLPKNFPDRKVLGVLIPSAEESAKYNRVGVLGTLGTVLSNTFPKEIKKLNKKIHPANGGTKVFQNSAPMLVPLAEEGEIKNAGPFIKKYLQPLLNKKINALVLGCTHYPIFKSEIRKEIAKVSGKKIIVISQDEIIPKKLKDYFTRHPEVENKLSLGRSQTGEAKKRTSKILVTDVTHSVNKLSQKWFGAKTKPILINL
jgi:glutamate racemase